MDPLSALGIAASIAQFLDVGFKVAKRLTEYNNATVHDVPKSLQSINTQLPLLLNSLSRVKSDAQVNRFDTDTKCILRGVLHGCSGIVTEIEELMNKAARQPGESLPTKLKKVLSSLKNDDRILSLDKNLRTYIQVLILHHVVDAADIPPSAPEEVNYYDVRERLASPYFDRTREIEKLHELFHGAARSQVIKPTVVVLQGDKGVGKSQIALDYCQQVYQLRQFQNIFWLDASTPDTLELSLESSAAVIRRTTEGKSEEKIRFFTSFLEDRWSPWLLVLDNYDHKAFGYEPVLSRLPQRGYGAILITSRQLGSSALGSVIEVLKFLTDQEEEQLNHRLRGAVESLNWDKVQDVVRQGFNVNQVDLALEWPFINRAALFGFEEAVDLFLKQGASMNLRPAQCSPLEWACEKGNIAIIKRLLDEEDRIQSRLKPHQYAACASRAVDKCHLPVLQILVARRAVDVDTKDGYGRPGFAKAAAGKDMELMRYLYQHGGGPKTADDKALTLVEAVKQEDLPMIKFLIEELKMDANAIREEDKYTALYAAAELKDNLKTPESVPMQIVTYLISKGANPMQESHRGEIPLHPAAMRNHTPMVELLLKHGSDVTHDGDGWSPITQAAKYNSPDVYSILISWPMDDVEKRAKYRAEVLQAAARWDKRELALAVLKAEGGVDIDAKDWRGQTPLLIAISKTNVPIARMLIRYGARQDIPDDEGRLPLLLAAEKGLELVIRELIKAKNTAGLEIKDKDENSALHIAAKGKHENAVRVLLEDGADRDEMNAYGETPLDIAEELKLKDIIKTLTDMSIGKK